MKFHSNSAEIYVPDGVSEEQALRRTTHMAVGAHQDDLEIMAAGAILDCFQQKDQWFTGVVVTDGRGSPRDDLYKDYTDEQMHAVRIKEQVKAALIGEYSALVMLDYPSKAVKAGSDQQPVEDLILLFRASMPKYVFTHNLADKHDTHVGVALKVIKALRSLAKPERPEKLFGCEVWRNLDWMVDSDKVIQDLTRHENLQAALLGVFDSQISGGKRYDLATMGRRRANATFSESHGVDISLGMAYAMDLTPLIQDPASEIDSFVQAHIARLSQDVSERLKRVS